jgi:hypothetical protein
MSRPYINTISASYTNPTFSIDMLYLRLRGGGTFSITGLSSSVIVFNVPRTYGSENDYSDTFNINVGRINGAVAPGSIYLSGVTGPTGSYLFSPTLFFSKLGGRDTFTFST